jgi:DNA-binding response OmpR family regulator
MPNTSSAVNIVIVEDDKILREELGHFLSSYGHTVHQTLSGAALDDLAEEIDFDILILDLNLPGQTGFEIAQRYRSRSPDLGIIVLSARRADTDRIKSYEDGADVYIPKPCPPHELLAAVHNLARRVKRKELNNVWKLDPIRHTLSNGDGLICIQLRLVENRIISALARAPQYQLSSDSLCKLIADVPDDETLPENVTRRSLENTISRIRKKFAIQAPGEPSLIKSVRGEGYQICVPVTVLLTDSRNDSPDQ